MEASSIGVVFDCDGTLLDSMDVWREVEGELADRAGVALTEADRGVLATLTIPEVGAYFHDRLGLGASAEHVVNMIDELMLAYYRERAHERPGALAFVRALYARGAVLSVASSSPQSYLRAGLERCGFTPYLQAIVSVDDVGASKREPVVYDRARELMGTPLATTWGFEDSSYALRTLRSAGYHTVGIYDCDLAGTYDELSALADITVRSFDELSTDAFLAHAARL